jgi:hypothetical protein
MPTITHIKKTLAKKGIDVRTDPKNRNRWIATHRGATLFFNVNAGEAVACSMGFQFGANGQAEYRDSLTGLLSLLDTIADARAASDAKGQTVGASQETPAETPAQRDAARAARLASGVDIADLPQTASADDVTGCALVLLRDKGEPIAAAYPIGQRVAVHRVGKYGPTPEVVLIGTVTRVAVDSLYGPEVFVQVTPDGNGKPGDRTPRKWYASSGLEELQGFIRPVTPEQIDGVTSLRMVYPIGSRVLLCDRLNDGEPFGTVQGIGFSLMGNGYAVTVQRDGDELPINFYGDTPDDFADRIAFRSLPDAEPAPPALPPAVTDESPFTLTPVVSYVVEALAADGSEVHNAAAWDADAARDLFLNGNEALDRMTGETAARIAAVRLVSLEHLPNGDTSPTYFDWPEILAVFRSMMRGKIEPWQTLTAAFRAHADKPTQETENALADAAGQYRAVFHCLPYPNPLTMPEPGEEGQAK